MRYRFFKKRLPKYTPVIQPINNKKEEIINEVEEVKEDIKEEVDETKEKIVVEDNSKKPQKRNKRNKTEEDMNSFERLAAAEATIDSMQPQVKVVKADKGLIERTESSKIILTEDNRQVLND